MKSRTLAEFQEQMGGADAKVPPFRIGKTTQQRLLRDHAAFLTYHRDVGLLKQLHRRGKRISEKRQRALIANAVEPERAFGRSLESSFELLGSQSPLLAYARERIRANFDDFRIYSNPVFFDPRTRKALVAMGLSMKELRHYHHVLSNDPRHVKLIRQTFEGKRFDAILRRANENWMKRPFPESHEVLTQLGVLTISGGGWFDDVGDFFVGAVAVVVGTVVASFWPVVGIGIAVAGAVGSTGIVSIGKGAPEMGLPGPIPPPSQAPPQPPPSLSVVPGLPVYRETPFYGNISRSKMEVHDAVCPWIHLIRPTNIRVYPSLADAHSGGLDNCAHCIGGSKR